MFVTDRSLQNAKQHDSDRNYFHPVATISFSFVQCLKRSKFDRITKRDSSKICSIPEKSSLETTGLQKMF